MAITYYQIDDIKIKAVDNDILFVKVDGKETKHPGSAYQTKTVSDVMGAPPITQEEYEK